MPVLSRDFATKTGKANYFSFFFFCSFLLIFRGKILYWTKKQKKKKEASHHLSLNQLVVTLRLRRRSQNLAEAIMVRKKVDPKVRSLIENSVKLRQRGLIVLVGDHGKDQVVNLHLMLSKTQVKARPSVLWCYKKEVCLNVNPGLLFLWYFVLSDISPILTIDL